MIAQKRLNRNGAKNAKKIVGANPCVRPKIENEGFESTGL